MKTNATLILLLCTFLGGSAIALTHSYFSGKTTESEQVQSENTQLGWNTFTADEAAKMILSMPSEQLAGEIIGIITQNDALDLRMQSYVSWMIECLVRNDPRKAIAIMCSKPFANADEKNSKFYGETIFTALAVFYPDCFGQYLLFINEKGNPDKLGKLNADLIKCFFDKLNSENPKLAYEMLTDAHLTDSMLTLRTEPIYGHYKDPDKTQEKKDIHSILSELQIRAVSGIGLNDRVLFDKTFSTASEPERYILIRKVAEDTLLSQHLENTVAWAKGSLTENEIRVFNEFVFSHLVDKSDITSLSRFSEMADLNSWQAKRYATLLSKTDPIAAIDFIEEKMKGSTKEYALASVLMELVKQRSFQEVLPMLANMQQGRCKTEVMDAIWPKFYGSEPENALKWIIDNEDTAFLKDKYSRSFSGEEQNYAFQKQMLEAGADKPFIRDLVIKHYRWGSKATVETLIGDLNGEKQRIFASDFYGDWLRNGDDLESCVEKMKTSEVLGDNKATVIREAIAEIAHTHPPDRLARSLSALDDPSMLPYAAEQYVWAFDGRTPQGKEKPVLEEAMESDIPENLREAIRTAWEAKRNGAAKPQNFKKEIYWGVN